MGGPAKLSASDRVTINPTADAKDLPDEGQTAAAETQSRMSAKLSSPSATSDDVFNTAPRVSAEFSAGGALSLPIGAILGARDSLRPGPASGVSVLAPFARPLGSRLFDADMTGAAYASFGLSVTPAGQGDGSDAFVFSAALRAELVAGAKTTGVPQAARELEGLLGTAAQLETDIRKQATDLERLVDDIKNAPELTELKTLLADGVSNADIKRIVELNNAFNKRLDKLKSAFASAKALVERTSGFMADAESKTITIGASAKVRGAGEFEFAARRKIFQQRGEQSNHEIVAGGAATFIVPMPQALPDAFASVGLRSITTMMVAVDALVSVQGRGFQDAEDLLSEVSGTIDHVAKMVDKYRATPAYLATKAGQDAFAKDISDLKQSTAKLTANAQKAIASAGVDAQTAVRITDANVPGVELSKLGIEARGYDSKFNYRLGVTLHHLLGVLPSRERMFTLSGIGEQPTLDPIGASHMTNGFYKFYSPSVTVDGAVGFSDGPASIELRAGIDAPFIEGTGPSGYLGLMGQIYGGYLSAGVSQANLAEIGQTAPLVMLGTGIATTGLELGAGFGFDPAAFGDLNDTKAVSGNLKMTVQLK